MTVGRWTGFVFLLVLCSLPAVAAFQNRTKPQHNSTEDTTSQTLLPPQPGSSSATVAKPQQVEVQPQPGSTGGTVTLKLETEAQKSQQSSSAEMLKSISELVGALTWPVVFIVLLVTQRRGLTQILASFVDVIGKSTRLKLGEIIDVEVDRSARQAEQNPVPAHDVPAQEREAAARVDKLVGETELPVVRQRMLEFAREYEATRANMKPGPSRTRSMNAVVAKMRTLAIAAKPYLAEFARADASPGNRLAAIAILQLSPSSEYISWLAERMAEEQPFVFFHASLALLAAVRDFGTLKEAELKSAIQKSLEIVNSFKGGHPDGNTVETLKQALSELSEASEQAANS